MIRNEIYRLKDIEMHGNEHGQLRKDTIYATLVDAKGVIVISATLEYILAAIRDHNYSVEGVTITFKNARSANCSTVSIKT